MRKLFLALSVWLLAAGVAFAAPGAVRCGKLLDVRTGQMLSDQIVSFDADGIITAVASAPGSTASAIDLSHATCLPGLIDVHTHVTDEPTGNGYAGLGISVPRQAVIGVKNGDSARQFSTMVEWGMKPLDAIQAATFRAADLMGWNEKVGSLEKGRYADLIAVDGDPLSEVKTLQHVKFVMKGGVVVRNDFLK